MTCCVGMRYRGGVLLGTDSFLGDKEEYLLMPIKALTGPEDSRWLYAGDYANALRFGKYLEAAGEWTPTLALDWLQDHPDRNSDVEDNRPDIEFLVGHKRSLYLCDGDGALCPVDWWAIGTGGHYARGSLQATLPSPTNTRKLNKTEAKRHLLNALQVAATLCPTVCEPFRFL